MEKNETKCCICRHNCKGKYRELYALPYGERIWLYFCWKHKQKRR